MSGPKVTMFLPTVARHRDGLLARAVESALNQSFTDFELIVVDDGSIDGTADYLNQKALEDSRLKVFRIERNTGSPPLALARAFHLAQGDFFAWLFDDCELEPQHLQKLIDALDANPEAGMAYGKARAQLEGDRWFEIGAPVDMASMHAGNNVVPNVCVVVRRETIETVGWYDPHVILKRLCDWDLWLRILNRYPVVFIDEVLAIEHGVGLPSSLGRLFQSYMDLAIKYARTERNERLSPAMLTENDVIRRDLQLSLTHEEAVACELLILEHSIYVIDVPQIYETSRMALSRGMLANEEARFSAQNGRTPDEHEVVLLSLRDLMQRRQHSFAESHIRTEVEIRRALEAADERSLIIADLTTRLETESSKADKLGRPSFNGGSGLDDRAARLEEELQNERRLRSELVKDLNEKTESLFIYRDAADRRLEMFREAESKLATMTQIADERLSELKRIKGET